MCMPRVPCTKGIRTFVLVALALLHYHGWCKASRAALASSEEGLAGLAAAYRFAGSSDLLDPHALSAASPDTILHTGRALAAAAPNTVYDLIVIGAGMSGLAAAKSAKDAGLSVLVLEARDRVGGRTYTQSETLASGKSVALDIGGAWIQGVYSDSRGKNPMVVLSEKAGIGYTPIEEDEVSFEASGQRTPQADVAREASLYKSFNSYLKSYWDAGKESQLPLSTLVERFVGKRGLSPKDEGLLRQVLEDDITSDYAGDLDQLAAMYFMDDLSWGGKEALPNAGCGTLAVYLAKGLNIKLSEAVTQIDYSPSDSAKRATDVGVRVTTRSGTYSARYVVVTLPLGYLQAHAGELFRPSPLPAAKLGAIASMGMGVLNKVILVWDQPWWGDILKVEWVTVRNPSALGQWSEYYNVAATGLKAPVLICFNFGSFGRSIESLTDEQQLAAALEPLQRLLPAGRTVPPTRQYIVTRWASDPWTLGSYSFAKAGVAWNYRGQLVAPVGDDRVRFAGEHTHTQFPATVHGAYLSGLREADVVVEELARRR